MNKGKEFLENIKRKGKELINDKDFLKKFAIIIGLIFVFAIVLYGGYSFFLGSNEKELESKLQNMGIEFYEDFYYKQIASNDEDRVTFLKKYETIGIKINLDNLSRYNAQDSNQVLKQFVNNKTKESCDKNSSQVIVYPQSPFDQTSYKIEVNLQCGFTK